MTIYVYDAATDRQIRFEGDLAYIPLTQGYEAIIDASDAHLIDGNNWYARVTRNRVGEVRSVYAQRWGKAGEPATVMMHRQIIGTSADGLDIDHIDGDGLNNIRANIRLSTRSQNGKNKKRASNNTSGVKGVYWNKAAKKWRANIEADGVSRHLGYFETIEDAAVAYSQACFDMHGEFGRVA